MQTIEVTIPVPRALDVATALSWAADRFDTFIARGWRVRDTWVLELGLAGVRGREGRLVFVVDRGGVDRGAVADSAGDRARLVVRSDGVVDLDGAWPVAVRAQLLAVLGDRVAW